MDSETNYQNLVEVIIECVEYEKVKHKSLFQRYNEPYPQIRNNPHF